MNKHPKLITKERIYCVESYSFAKSKRLWSLEQLVSRMFIPSITISRFSTRAGSNNLNGSNLTREIWPTLAYSVYDLETYYSSQLICFKQQFPKIRVDYIEITKLLYITFPQFFHMAYRFHWPYNLGLIIGSYISCSNMKKYIL